VSFPSSCDVGKEPYAEQKSAGVRYEQRGAEFKAGMYLYALIVDEKVIDTKRMILTK